MDRAFNSCDLDRQEGKFERILTPYKKRSSHDQVNKLIAMRKLMFSTVLDKSEMFWPDDCR